MLDIIYKRCSTGNELEQILSIQKRNLRTGLTEETRANEGFLTVSHSMDILSRMNETCPHILAKSGSQVAGYALCMHPNHSNDIPVLKPMFKKIDKLLDKGIKYMAMGQICIDKTFRRKGVFAGLYKFMGDQLREEYDVIITEVDSANVRSLGAHYKVGFKDLLAYQSAGHTWHLIQWPL